MNLIKLQSFFFIFLFSLISSQVFAQKVFLNQFKRNLQSIISLIDEEKKVTLSKLGKDFSIILTGSEGDYEGFHYKKLGLTLVFEDNQVAWIECDKSVDINGIHAGMTIPEIKKKLGISNTKFREDFIKVNDPKGEFHTIEYKNGPASIEFEAYEKDGIAGVTIFSLKFQKKWKEWKPPETKRYE